MKAYKLTGYSPYWINNDEIVNFIQIEDLLRQIYRVDPWVEIPKNNFTWNNVNDITFIDKVDSYVCYIKIIQGNTTFYFKKIANEIISTKDKDGNLLVEYKYELDLWNTYIYELIQLLLKNHCTVHFKRCFLDRLLRLDGKYVLNFKLQKYLSDIIPLNNLTTIREYVNGTNVRKMYELNNPLIPYDDLHKQVETVKNWAFPDDTSRNITINIGDYFSGEINNEGFNHRFAYIIAKTSALRKIDNSRDVSSNTSQNILLIPCTKSNVDNILHGLNDIGITIAHDSCIIVGTQNTISSKLVELSSLLLYDWYKKHTDTCEFLYGTNKIDDNTSVNIPFIKFPFNQPFLFDIFDYYESNSRLGIGKKIIDLINNLDKLIPESEPLLLNPAYYYEIYNNGLTYYTTSFADLNLEFLEGKEMDETLKLSAYFNFFSNIDMSFYYGNKTNTYDTSLDNTNTKTVDIGIPWGIIQGASATYLENNLNTGYTGLLNRQSEEQQAVIDTTHNVLNSLLSTVVNPLTWATGIGTLANFTKWGMNTARTITDSIMEQQRANNSFYASIKNTINSPSNINTSPFSKANIPLHEVDGNVLFLMYAIHLHSQCRDLVMGDYLHNGYVYDARDDINTFINRKYMNVLSIAGTDTLEDIFSIWEKEYTNNIFKNKFWFTIALDFLSSTHKFYMTPYLVNCTDWKRDDYIHNIEINSYNIPNMKQNITSIIQFWPSLFPANKDQILTILKAYNVGLTDEVINELNISFDENSIVISVKDTSTIYKGQILINSYQYNLLIQINNSNYYIYDFNQLCVPDNSYQTITVRTSNGDITINVETSEINYFAMIQYPSITTIIKSFLRRLNIKCPIRIAEGILLIDHYFLCDCTSFNQPLTLPNSITRIFIGFLENCTSFNQPLTLPNSITSIEGSFLENCTSFNQPLTLPNSLERIGSTFLKNCISFNQSLTLPNLLKQIGTGFLANCTSFNQPLAFPNSLTYLGPNFIYNTDNYTNTINFNNLRTDVLGGESALTFTTNNINAPMYTVGITIEGTYKNDIVNRFPNSDVAPYRKLIIVDESNRANK